MVSATAIDAAALRHRSSPASHPFPGEHEDGAADRHERRRMDGLDGAQGRRSSRGGDDRGQGHGQRVAPDGLSRRTSRRSSSMQHEDAGDVPFDRGPLVGEMTGPVRLMRPAIRPGRGSDDRVDVQTVSEAADLALIDAWWRAANYLSVGQIYLMANPLLREPLAPEHVKPRLLGHWGTTPGTQSRLRPCEPGRQGQGPRCDLDRRAGARRAGGRRQRLPGGHRR